MQSQEKNELKLLALIIILGLALRLAGGILFPVWSGPEEGAHFVYTKLIGDNGALPMIPLTKETLASIYNESIHQPPLFYMIAAVFYLPLAGQDPEFIVHLLRLLSIAFGTAGIPLTYLIAKRLGFGKTVRLGAAMFIALLPTHIVTSATLSNSTLSGLFSLGIIYYSIKVLQEKKAIDMALAGILMAASIMTMFTGLAVAIAFGIAWVVFLLRGKEVLWKRAIACATPVLGTPVFLRNLALTGHLFPSYLRPMVEINGAWLAYFSTHLFAGIWLQEYGTATIPDYRFVFFGFYAIISLVAFIGVVRLLPGREWKSAGKKIVAAVLVLPILLNLAGVAYMNFFGTWPEARWLFPTIGLAGILLIAGLISFAEMLGQKARANALVWAFLFTLLLLDLVLLVNYNRVLPDIIWNVPVF